MMVSAGVVVIVVAAVIVLFLKLSSQLSLF